MDEYTENFNKGENILLGIITNNKIYGCIEIKDKQILQAQLSHGRNFKESNKSLYNIIVKKLIENGLIN